MGQGWGEDYAEQQKNHLHTGMLLGKEWWESPCGQAGRQPQCPCQLSSQGHQGVQSLWGSAGTFHEHWSSQEQTHLSREKLTQLFGPLGETNHWQILEKHLLKSLMP